MKFIRDLMRWTTDYSDLPAGVEINRGFVQCPTSDEPPPVPESMRSHYRPEELDENGYRIALKKKD